MAASIIPILIMAAASAAQQAAASRASRQGMEMSDAQHRRQLGFDESQSNPFRQQLSQAQSIGALDRMKGSHYTPYRMGGSGSYTDPLTPSGGYSFESDPRTRVALDTLYDSVLHGETPARGYMDDEEPLVQVRGAVPGRGVVPGAATRAPGRDPRRGGMDILPLLSRV